MTDQPLRTLAGSLFSLVSLAGVSLTSATLADTVNARCDVFSAGEDKAVSSGLCAFSQRQGFVTIRLAEGQTIQLRPNESTPGAFFDQQNQPAQREILEGNRGQVYRLAKQSIFVFWDTAPYPNK